MPRTESYLLRLTPEEKNELGDRAREQGISIAKLIRQRLALDAMSGDPPGKVLDITSTPAEPRYREQTEEEEKLQTLVVKHRPFMSQPRAEAKARKELES